VRSRMIAVRHARLRFVMEDPAQQLATRSRPTSSINSATATIARTE